MSIRLVYSGWSSGYRQQKFIFYIFEDLKAYDQEKGKFSVDLKELLFLCSYKGVVKRKLSKVPFLRALFLFKT